MNYYSFASPFLILIIKRVLSYIILYFKIPLLFSSLQEDAESLRTEALDRETSDQTVDEEETVINNFDVSCEENEYESDTSELSGDDQGKYF